MALSWIFRRWLQAAAEEKLRQAVLGAAQQQSAAARDDPDAEPQRGGVAVIFALEAESGGLEDLLHEPVRTKGHGFRLCQGPLGGRPVIVVQSGVGQAAAARATAAVIDAHRPAWVISAGFAGAVRPGVERGDLLLADRVLDAALSSRAIDRSAVPAELIAMDRVHVGPLLAVSRIISLPEEKRALGRQSGALAVDMETLAVAEVCQQRGVPMLAVRVISDTLDDTLPRDLEHLIEQRSPAGRLGAALGAVFNRPGSVKDLLRLKNIALDCSDRLAKFLARLIAQLPEEREEQE